MFQLEARQRRGGGKGVSESTHARCEFLSQHGTHKATSLQHCKTHVVVSLHELAFACEERHVVL